MRATLASTPPTPQRITAALDLAGLHGPEVDAALGVPEPTVDLWESGDLVPTRSQVRRLALLTGFGERYFYLPASKLDPENIFICQNPDPEPVTPEGALF